MRWLSVFSIVTAGPCLLATGRTVCAVDHADMEALLDAIAQVESRSEPNAVGDHGRAAGVYQIHQAYWEDGTRILGVDWRYRDARDPEKARQVVRAYLSHYGKGKSLIDLARIHNGGPQGDEKKATLAYAHKVAAVLERG
jgi:soluble lytic murein transglycosylase-like protein